MRTLQAGERLPLGTLGLGDTFTVAVRCTLPGTDVSAFCLQEARLARDEDMVFYNQPASPEGGVLWSSQGEETRFTLDLSRLPRAVSEVVFAATHDDTPVGQAPALQVTTGGSTFDVRPYLNGEKAVMLVRVYRHAGGWRLGTVAQGFNGGLAALVRHFGGEVDDLTAVPTVPSTPPGPVSGPAPAPAPAPPPVSLQKVTLGKQQQVKLQKARHVTATLEWRGQGDLDLYAFYVLRDGTSGKVYYREKGARTRPPYITLNGDSRTPGRETIQIHRPDELRYVLIAAYSAVGNGFGSFRSYQPRAVITDPLGQEAVIPVLHKNWFSYWVALTLMDFSQPDGNVVGHVETYSRAHVENSPVLHPDGRFEMNKGPIEFK